MATVSASGPTLSIIIATAGRSSLTRTLGSIVPQLEPGDEILVLCNDDGSWGYPSRTRGVEKATGDLLLYVDDDDVYLPDAFERIRDWARLNPGCFGIFRRQFVTGEKQWREPVLRRGNVQCMNFVVPNVPGRIAEWGVDESWSDIEFVTRTAELQGARWEFVDEVIGLARPERNPLRRLRYRLTLRTRLSALRVSLARSWRTG